MPKDFAGRSGASKTRHRNKNTRKASPKQRVLFHGPSFYFGALVGAAIIVLVVYAPELLEQNPTGKAAEVATEAVKPKVEFEFADILKNSEVKPQPEDYVVPSTEQAEPASYTIQAASFRVKDDAETLRGRLTLEGMNVRTLSIQVDQSIWYRVVVGPFNKKVEADRAMTRLRELGLSAIWVNRHN
jgi:cell division protein FtsN